ncbi:MAG: TIGR03943 family protein [Thermodesulfobacteriota bacterium]|nr:TIGR03943 family protein [Thermodesulfobacteriota bacterium]
MIDLERGMRCVVLFGWAILYAFLLGDSDQGSRLQQFLNPSLKWLIICGLLAAALMLFETVTDGKKKRTSSRKERITLLIQTGILLLPFFYFPLATTGHLGIDAFQNRFIGGEDIRGALEKEEQDRIDETDGDLFQELLKMGQEYEKRHQEPKKPSLMQLMRNPQNYEGKKIEVLGMVTRDEQLPPQTLYAFRFFINCCAADAIPVGVLVRYSGELELEPGQWIRVTGRGGLYQIGKETMPLIVSDHLETVEKPKYPYVFF